MVEKQKYRLVLIYDPERDDFFRAKEEEIADPQKNVYLVIDELERKSTLSFPANTSLIAKRTVERRVSSYLKGGYPLDDRGLRIGANFPFEKVGADEKLPDILLTHGHSYRKKKLIRDDIPDYVKKEDTYEVIPGSAAKTPMIQKSEVGSGSTAEGAPVPKSPVRPESDYLPPPPEPRGKVSVTRLGQTLEFKAVASNKTATDNEIFALGQFVDQFVRKGRIVMAYYDENERYRICTISNVSTRMAFDSDSVYEIVGT